MKHLRFSTGILLTALGGILLVLAGNLCAAFTPTGLFGLHMMLFNGGLVCAGLLLWVTACTALSLWARNGLHAAVLVLTLLGSAVFTEAALTVMGTGRMMRDSVLIWILLLPVSAVCALLIYRSRRSFLLRAAAALTGIVIFLFDFFVCSGGEPLAVTTELALLILLLYCLHAAAVPHRQNRSVRCPGFISSY